MPTTITGFFTFAGGSRARASEVNSNFNTFRGTLLPFESDTSAASHREHDLGATDHYWLNQYVQKIFVGTTSTGGNISGDSLGSVAHDVNTTGAQHDFKISASTMASIKNDLTRIKTALNIVDGSNNIVFARPMSVTYSAQFTATYSVTGGGGTTLLTQLLSLTGNGGAIRIGLVAARDTNASYVSADKNSATDHPDIRLFLLRETSTGGTFTTLTSFYWSFAEESAASVNIEMAGIKVSPNLIDFLDTSAPAGGLTYRVAVDSQGGVGLTYIFSGVRIRAIRGY